MKLISVYLTEEQIFYLSQLPEDSSTNIRKAIDEYLKKHRKELQYSSSTSPSISPSTISLQEKRGGEK